MQDAQGREYPLVGAVKGTSYPTGKLVRFGYVSITAAPGKSGYLMPGETIKGHEFHYWDSTDCGEDCLAEKPDKKRRWKCIHMDGSLFAGYPHLYLPSMPEFSRRFIRRCRTWRRKEK